jgi:hypothetical protein
LSVARKNSDVNKSMRESKTDSTTFGLTQVNK